MLGVKRTERPTDPLAARVWVERYRRYWSIRDAAEGSGVSNQTWSSWEKVGGPPSEKVRAAVARRFGWPSDWPENPPEIEGEPPVSSPGVDLSARVERLERDLKRVLVTVDDLHKQWTDFLVRQAVAGRRDDPQSHP